MAEITIPPFTSTTPSTFPAPTSVKDRSDVCDAVRRKPTNEIASKSEEVELFSFWTKPTYYDMYVRSKSVTFPIQENVGYYPKLPEPSPEAKLMYTQKKNVFEGDYRYFDSEFNDSVAEIGLILSDLKSDVPNAYLRSKGYDTVCTYLNKINKGIRYLKHRQVFVYLLVYKFVSDALYADAIGTVPFGQAVISFLKKLIEVDANRLRPMRVTDTSAIVELGISNEPQWDDTLFTQWANHHILKITDSWNREVTTKVAQVTKAVDDFVKFANEYLDVLQSNRWYFQDTVLLNYKVDSSHYTYFYHAYDITSETVVGGGVDTAMNLPPQTYANLSSFCPPPQSFNFKLKSEGFVSVDKFDYPLGWQEFSLCYVPSFLLATYRENHTKGGTISGDYKYYVRGGDSFEETYNSKAKEIAVIKSATDKVIEYNMVKYIARDMISDAFRNIFA